VDAEVRRIGRNGSRGGFMNALQERLQGIGELGRWESPGQKIRVEYDFEITTRYLERTGFPRVATRRDSIGFVRGLSRELLPAEEEYRLTASDGEILKVKHVFPGHWVILAQ